MIGLETCFGVLGKLGISEERIISLISASPRKIFNLPDAGIRIGNTADLTLYVPGEEFVFNESMIRSKSKNTPFTGHHLNGKVIGIVSKDSLYLND
jgi:dihydroorotase